MIVELIDMLFILGVGFILSFSINKTLTPKYNKYISHLFYTVVAGILYYIVNYAYWFAELVNDFSVRQNMKTIGLIVLDFLFPVLFFKDSFRKKILVFVTMIATTTGYEALLTVLFIQIFDKPIILENELSLSERIIVDLFVVIVQLLSALTIYFICRKRNLKINKKVLFNLTAIIIVNCIMVAFIFTSNAYNKDVFTKIVLLVAPLMLMFLCFTMYKLMKRLNETEVMKEKLYWVENIKGMELDYYNKLQEKTNEVRKIRHDFKDNLETAMLLIKENSEESIEKASEIISAMEKSINATKLPVYTENVVVNAIVGAKAEEASKKGITLETQIDVPKELSIESIDLNCVFLNLLNNAIEASEKLQKEEKHISLKSGIKAGYLFVKVENEFNEVETNSAGELITTKEDKENHGIGTSLLSEIAKKYDGEFETNQEENKFIAVVSMKI